MVFQAAGRDLPDEACLTALRLAMVETQIAARGVREERILEAMREVPRHHFVPSDLLDRAYADSALPIDSGQTISQPFTVAYMCAAAEVATTTRVLEIGTGSGYAAAILGRLCATVFSIEINPGLAADARARLAALGVDNVTVRVGDGRQGLADEGPFDAIFVTARADAVPSALREQLRIGGRLVIPIGPLGEGMLQKLTRRDPSRFDVEDLGAFSFVPMVST